VNKLRRTVKLLRSQRQKLQLSD